MSKKLFMIAAAAIVAASASANAQSLATFGSAELAGFGEGSALLGASLGTGRQGLGPVAGLVAQTYRYRSGASDYSQAYSISPSLGLQYTMEGGSVQGSLGYTFVSVDEKVNPARVVVGLESGSRNSAFVSTQANYWGNGENSAQAIASYSMEAGYYWTRLRASHRLAPTAQPIYAGAEVVLQGTQKGFEIGNTGVRTGSVSRFQVGPTIEYRVSPSFRVGASAGYRGGNNNAPGSGYARIEFLHLSRLGGM